MHLYLYVLDPWARLATQASPAQIAQLMARLPQLSVAQWQLQPKVPTLQLSQNLYDKNACANACPYWLSPIQTNAQFALIPVRLSMLRDSFSLQEVVSLERSLYEKLSTVLQTHFSDVLQIQPDPYQSVWWVQTAEPVSVNSPWPSDCLYQSAFAWQPEGKDANLLRGWTNETQMLLHALQADHEDWPAGFNSLWFASIPQVPEMSGQHQSLGGQGRVWEGLQLRHNLSPVQRMSGWLDDLPDTVNSHALWLADTFEDIEWTAVDQWLQHSRQAVTLVLPFAEQSLSVVYQPPVFWQRWTLPWRRTVQTADSIFDKLLTQLPHHHVQ